MTCPEVTNGDGNVATIVVTRVAIYHGHHVRNMSRYVVKLNDTWCVTAFRDMSGYATMLHDMSLLVTACHEMVSPENALWHIMTLHDTFYRMS